MKFIGSPLSGIKLAFAGDKRECPLDSLLLWCLSVPEAL
jgi:hypothetical protein